MREGYARRAAVASALLVGGAAVLFAAIQGSGAARASAGAIADSVEVAPTQQAVAETPQSVTETPPPQPDALLALGRRVYDEEGCAACHSIAGVGGRRGALDGVGERLDRETIRLWIVDPQAVRPGIRKPSYPNLSAERLDALIAFLESLAGR